MLIVRPIAIGDGDLVSDAADATAAWNSGTTYSLAQTVQVGRRRYESLQGSNTNHSPASSPTWWLDIGPVNKWAMFDDKTATQTTWSLSGEVEISGSGVIDTIGLLNVDAAMINITMLDGVDEVFNEDFPMVSDEGIDDYYEYFFEPITRETELVVEDLPNILDPTVVITATDTDAVAIGHCVLGLSRDLGDTQTGAEFGITSYSQIEEDAFGELTIVPRGYRDTGRFTVWVPQARVKAVKNLLTQYRDTAVLVIGAEDYSATYYFGLLKTWRVVIEHHRYSILSVEILGF